jgi:hypothetical protein
MEMDKAVQGVAVYLEFARTNATTQIIVTPDGYTSDGVLVPSTLVRRTITTTSPKKQWRFSRLLTASDVSSFVPTVDENTMDQFAEERIKYAATLFDQLLRGEWKLVKTPILIEASKKDYDFISQAKTPTKMLYRISQSRTALDFPAEIVNTV